MRATSSITSASRVTSSRRWWGTVASSPSAAGVTSKPSASRILPARSLGISAPSSRVMRALRRRMRAGPGPGPPTSIVPGSARAPHTSAISALATAWASRACSGCSCFSNRAEASLRSPSRVEVRWMLGPFQVAASISTLVVASETSERAPPITPAIEVGPSSSQITTTSPSSRRSSPSERGDRLALARRGAPAAARPLTCRQVEGVQRLAGQQHHVVGDVDHVGDGALAGGHQARLQPRRRGPDAHVLEARAR